MPRFAAVLRLREEAEDAARRELGRAEGARRQAEADRDGLVADLAAARAAPVAPAWRSTLQQYEQHQTGLIARATTRMDEAAAQADAARLVLTMAMAEVKAIRVLVERDARERSRQEQRREDRQAAERAALALITAGTAGGAGP